MSFKSTVAAMSLAFLSPSALMAEISVADAYARASSPSAKAGAAFMVLENSATADDRLLGARSDAAKKVELHTHAESADGVMKMLPIEGGIVVPAGGSHTLKRGGDHVMFMGLTGPFEQGETVTVTLEFEKAGDLVVEIPVDLNR